MSKFKVVNLIDKVFITVCVFLVIYAWINFFIKNLVLTFILSLIFTFACVFLLFFLISKQQTKKNINKEKLKEIDEKFLAFRLLSNENKILLISKILSLAYKTEIKNNALTYVKNNKKHLVIIATQYEQLNNYEIVNLLQNLPNKVDVIDIVCNNYALNINAKILKNIEIEFITKTKLYEEYFNKNQIFPDTSKINNGVEKFKLKEIFKNFFLPHKAKSFFFCGLILIFSAIILPYHYYYLIFGTTLLICSIICKIKPLIGNSQ